jgi:hypothetical protein
MLPLIYIAGRIALILHSDIFSSAFLGPVAEKQSDPPVFREFVRGVLSDGAVAQSQTELPLFPQDG